MLVSKTNIDNELRQNADVYFERCQHGGKLVDNISEVHQKIFKQKVEDSYEEL